MDAAVTIEPFGEGNVADYERLTEHGNNGKPCYCSFWHRKWTSMDEYHEVQRDRPERLRECVLDRMRSRFHVGVIAYRAGTPCAWVSVGPLIDFFWAWRRVAQLGAVAKTTAGIVCFTVAPALRGQGMQERVLSALVDYGRRRGWTAVEAYPFADEAIAKHGETLKWAGLAKGYENAGFQRVGEHWLSQPDFPRHLYALPL
jgi:GNAT superfamily N-acetyltransferase